jgi:pyridoxal phosphate enzyme (YggS family)
MGKHELSSLQETLQHNLGTVASRIERACRMAGRLPQGVQLVAVTKYAEWEWVKELARLRKVFGESRPQQLAERQPQLPDVQWHLIGQIQHNKARLAIQHADVIHSVDSLKLLERLSQLARKSDRVVRILLQVNVSGESSKSGFDPQALLDSWQSITISAGSHLKITGLMTMAPKSEDPECARPVFARLSQLRQELNGQGQSVELTELSMGMSGDFEIAIEEGATLIRVGSSLFDGLCPSKE